jgi:superfamily II DNA helicase RecQ
MHACDRDIWRNAVDVEAALKVAVARVGVAELRDKQREAIESFVSGKDVFVALPTGYGKSLCYQILPSLFDALRGHPIPTSIIVVVGSANLDFEP